MEKYKILAEVLLDISKIPITSESYTDDIEKALVKAFDANFVTWFKSGKHGDSFIFNNSHIGGNNRIRFLHLESTNNGVFLLGTPKIDYLLEDFLIENLKGALLNFSLMENHVLGLKNQMFKDDLTGVSNYKAFENRVSEQKEYKNVSLAFVDVNGLGVVNNTLGHEAGDFMLLTVASIMSKYFRKSDIYRKGGDEFIVLAEGLSKEEVEARMELIVEDLKSYDYSISYGISHQDTCSDIEPMIKESDVLMYEQKEEYRKNNPSKYLVLKKAKE